MHNNIMVAGSRDRLPMLETKRYDLWQSHFMRYIDTRPNGEALKKCIQQGPNKLSHIIIPGQPVTDESQEVPERTIVKTFLNISLENKAHYDEEKEAIHFLLTGTGMKFTQLLMLARQLMTYLLQEMESKLSHITLGILLRSAGNQRAKDYTYHKEKMLLCKQVKKELGYDTQPLEKVQYDAEYNVFSNERQHSKQLESINDIHVVEKDDNNVIPNSSNMSDNDNQADQNAKECDDERVVLTNLISNLKLDTNENKKIQKQLKKANTPLSHELEESALKECKSSLEKSNKTQDRYLVLKAQMKYKNITISELKKLIEKVKENMDTKFDKLSTVRQPNALRIPKPSVLGKSTLFSDSLERKSFLKTKSVTKTNVSEGVIHNTSFSRPQLRSTRMKESIMHTNSQVKFKKT
nr:hypothetical protein [Tanacetum cinerariifolium]